MKVKNIILVMLTLLFISCDKENDMEIEQTEPNYFMSAFIDDIYWETSGIGNARFSAEYISSKERFSIHIQANNMYVDPKPLDNGKMISFDFDFTPRPGKYYFNNDRCNQLDSGIIATYTYWNQNHYAYKWSNSGYVDIKAISRDSISGTFLLTVKGDTTNYEITKIADGKFNAIYGGSSGKIWPGPEE
jgi:hypothetical protein